MMNKQYTQDDVLFFATRITFRFMRTISLPACENHAIHRTMFVLALNDAENIPLSENIVVVCVPFTHIPLPPFEDTDTWLTGVGY